MKDSFAQESLTGNLLVASSLVSNPMYSAGVCLVVHQDADHVIGVMLNRPMKPNPDAMAKMFGKKSADPESKNRLDGPPPQDDAGSEPTDLVPKTDAVSVMEGMANLGLVHFGGPLSGPVVAIHQLSQFAETETGAGIYMAAQKQHLEDLVRQKPGAYRLIVGHLGWETEQLQHEIEAGVWHTLPATAESVFASATSMWPGLIRRATSRSLARWIRTPDVLGAAELN